MDFDDSDSDAHSDHSHGDAASLSAAAYEPRDNSPTHSPTAHAFHSGSAPALQHAHAHAHSSSGPNGGPPLNPRSCITCRRRKVRCNKQYPCSNCARNKTQCIFPAPERAKRRTRKPPDSELLSRLRKLEGVIQGMGMSVEDELGKQLPLPGPGGSASAQYKRTASDTDSRSPSSPGGDITHEFDRLVIDQGKSRYVNNKFWSSLSNEIQDLKGMLDQTSDEEDDMPTPSTEFSTPPPDAAFFFGYSSLAYDLHSLHPPQKHIWEFWKCWKEYNDPIIKVVHTPTMEAQIRAVMHAPGKTTKPWEAFLFTVYFAVVTALNNEDCLAKFGEPRDTLVRKYRFGVEQALARAQLITTEQLLVLQSFVIYLICLRCHEDGRAGWSLCGLAFRLSISMGLHRDGTHFGLAPFETEMRRRLWCSQDSGIEPLFLMADFWDTRLPLNVNDEDLSPDMTEFPEPKQGITETTFSIMRYDLQRSMINVFAPNTSLQDKERAITETNQHLEKNYFVHCDLSQPLDWTLCTVSKLFMARQFLLLYFPYIQTLQQETIDRLFATALDTIEFALRLETERKLVKWGWLFKTYNTWHALAFLLSELRRRTKGPLVQRAWRAVNSTLVEFREIYHDSKRGYLWRPLGKLLQDARLARERELAAESNMALDVATPPGHCLTDRGNADASNAAAQGGFLEPNALQMPLLEQTLSGRSNNVDDKYAFDNTSSNMAMQSEFFANTPGLWQPPGGSLPPGAPGVPGDWFGNWAVENNLNPEFDQSVFGGFGLAGLDTPTAGAGNGNGAAPAAFGLQDAAPGSAMDPRLNGLKNPGPGAQWTDWDEVVREFEISGPPLATPAVPGLGAFGGGANTNAAANAANNNTGAWPRPPLLGETWL